MLHHLEQQASTRENPQARKDEKTTQITSRKENATETSRRGLAALCSSDFLLFAAEGYTSGDELPSFGLLLLLPPLLRLLQGDDPASVLITLVECCLLGWALTFFASPNLAITSSYAGRKNVLKLFSSISFCANTPKNPTLHQLPQHPLTIGWHEQQHQ